MDLRLVILGMVFVVVLVMMGDNPFKVPEEYKRDPFRYRLEKKLAEEEKKKGINFDDPTSSALFGAKPPSQFTTPGYNAPGMPGMPGQPAIPGAPGSVPNMMDQNSILVPGPGGAGYVVQQKPGTFSSWQQFQQTVEQAQAAQKNGVAPTVPGGQVATPGQAPGQLQFTGQPGATVGLTPGQVAQPAEPLAQGQAQQRPQQPDGAPAFFLRDGRRVFFSGYRVYVLIPDGQIQLLPDGDHTLSSGEILVIRNGKRRAIR